jgi:hypothetical protein
MPVSLSKLDLPWLAKDRPVQPGRYISEEARAKRQAEAEHAAAIRSDVACPTFMPDVDQAYGGAWKSIVDGKEISSRSNWREHNKRNSVVDVGDNFWCQGMEGGDTAANTIKRTREKMGYDPQLIGKDFSWKTPEKVK